MVIFTGFFNKAEASVTIESGIVAEKNKVCFSFGSFGNIRLISWINPISSIRSASSSTKYFTWSRLRNPWLIKSSKRPGVATRISIPFCNIVTCGRWFTPPNITPWRTGVYLAYSSKHSLICKASSRVGVRIKALTPLRFVIIGSACKSWMIGIANEAVFPVPVCAHPNISFRDKATGIACCWIGVGLLYPFSSIAFKIGWIIFNSLNVIYYYFAVRQNSIYFHYLIFSAVSDLYRTYNRNAGVTLICFNGAERSSE